MNGCRRSFRLRRPMSAGLLFCLDDRSAATCGLGGVAPLYRCDASRRFLRTRQGRPLSGCAIELAEHVKPAVASHRPLPIAMAPSYVCDQLTGMAKYQTEKLVWLAPTLQEAWVQLYASYAEACGKDSLRAAEMRERDLVGLGLCTTYVETLHLLSLLPPELRDTLSQHPTFVLTEVEEFFIHLGQSVEVRGGDWVVQLAPPGVADLQYFLKRAGRFGEDGRGTIANTSHRVAVWRGRQGEALGVTIRVGRYVPNAARALLPLARQGNLLILSRAGVGKTTLLRDLAATLAQEPGKPRVTVVDTSNEIGGDSPIPTPFLGRCRRIQVSRREEQSRVMAEVIQNHTPEFLIVDELATLAEAEAAWSIAQRGTRLIATCHGESLSGLLQNRALNLLVGGAAQAFLSNEERRLKNKIKKTILERPHCSPFHFVVELSSREVGHVFTDVNRAVDLILDDQPAKSNAAVGGRLTPSDPLPRRIEQLLYTRERALRSAGLLPCRAGRGGGGLSSLEEVDNDNGDESPHTETIHERSPGRPNGKARHVKSDEEILQELSRCL